MRRMQEELEQLRPKELLYGSSAPLFESTATSKPSFARPTAAGGCPLQGLGDPTETPLDDWIFAPDHAHSTAGKSFWRVVARGIRAGGRSGRGCAAGAILYYVRSTQRGSLDHVDRIGWYERQNCLVLDAVTVRNLELIEPLFAGTDAGVTLFRSNGCAVTPMGKRLLRAWLLRPSLDVGEINARLDAVEARVKEIVAREELRRALDGVLDLERLLSRVTLEAANPRDVLALAASLARIPANPGRAAAACCREAAVLHAARGRTGRCAGDASRRRLSPSRR